MLGHFAVLLLLLVGVLPPHTCNSHRGQLRKVELERFVCCHVDILRQPKMLLMHEPSLQFLHLNFVLPVICALLVGLDHLQQKTEVS